MPIDLYRDHSVFEKSPVFDFSDKDESGNPIVIGRDYSADISKIIEEPEKYSVIKGLLENDSADLQRMYRRLERYYQELTEKYKDSDNLDDDDF